MRFNVLFCIDFFCLVTWAFLAKQTEAHASRSLISPIVRCITAANIGNHPVCNGCPACHAPLEPVVPLLPDHALPEHGIWCLYPRRRHLPAKVEAWLAFLHERLALR